jgi:TonB-dependent starch-binding outer membrane protein SusC
MKKPILLASCGSIYSIIVNNFLKIFAVTLTLFFASVLHVSAQDHPVTGRIVSADGEGIPGVTVAVKGTSVGTVTDSTGNYSISAPDSATLVFSYLGYVSQEVRVGSQSEMNITLAADKADEVVVIGYGTQKKQDVTGAISTVKSAELNRVVVTDPVQALQGRVTGVSVTQNTGAPGAPLTIRVRGVGTINNSDPLYVVNGVPVGDISFLNSNDIESIDVLKDASAAAVYGARAANGVVLVTTKSGTKRKTTFDFNFLTGVSSAWKKYDLLNAKEWATLKNEAQMADNGTVKYNTDTIGTGTDWQSQIFRKAIMKSYYLGASGGTEKSNYYLSGSYLSQEGILKNSNYERFNFNMRADYQLAKRLKVGIFTNTAFSNRSQLYDGDPYNSVISNALNADPITPVYSGRGGDSTYASGSARTDVPNPLARLNNYHNKYKGINFLGNWFAEYQIIKGLKFKSSLGVNYSSTMNNQFNGKYYVSNSEQLTESQVITQQNVNRLYVWENSLIYNKTIGKNHKIDGLLLTGMQDNRSEFFRVQKNNTPSNDPSQQYLNSATDPSASASGAASEWSLLSYLIRVNYEFKNKYIITANARRDGSSRFQNKNRYGTFPSFAAGWKVSEEAFFEPLKNVVSFMKVRASWGKLGNQNIGSDYPYTTNISQGYNYSFGGNAAPGATPLGAGNPNIRWEKVTTSNLGVDLQFFNNSLSFSVDYFIKNTSDMLIQKRIPNYTGVEVPPYVNGGAMSNKGWEFYLAYTKQVGELKFRVGGNLTAIKNRVTKMEDPIYGGQFRTQFTNITQQGSAVSQFYGYETNGIVQTAEEAASLQTAQPGVRPGDFKYKDLDGDGVITDKDRTTLGSPLPKFVYGITGEVSYKGFDLNILLQGSQGNKIFNGSKYTLASGVTNSNFSTAMLDRWTGPGSTNETPRVTNNDVNNNRRISNYYIENGSYLRVKSIQLGYTIPDALTNAIKLQKLRIFIMGQNLLTFTKYTGLDPEIGTYTPDFSVAPPSYLDMGVDKGGTYPQARTWLIGLNASF